MATEQVAAVPDELAESVAAFTGIILANPAARGDACKGPIDVDEGAPTTDRLVAFLGRQP